MSLLVHVHHLTYNGFVNEGVVIFKRLTKVALHFFSWLLAILLLGFFWIWLMWFSPFGYQPPAGMPAIEQTSHQVFVFGTLKSPWIRWLVMGRKGDVEPAELRGMRREKLTLVSDPEQSTHGYLIKVTAEELARLDHYERLGVRYERVKMQLVDGQEAWVYRRL